MIKRILALLALIGCSLAFSGPSTAATVGPSASTVQKPVDPANPPSVASDDGTVNLTPQDMENMLKAEETILKKIKIEHQQRQRQEHTAVTQQVYEQALNLYHQQRMNQAQQTLNTVEVMLPDYKSTVSLLKTADRQAAVELNHQIHRIKEIENPKVAMEMENRALMLYQEASYLSDQQDSPKVREQLKKLQMAFQVMSQQVYIQRQLEKIAQEADVFDQEVFKLTEAKDYPAAKRKFGEFQQAMVEDFIRLKQTIQFRDSLTVP